MVGAKVEITGVVVGVDNQAGVSNFTELDPRQEGIYVETPTAEQDTDTQTSEGIFVGGLPAEDRSAEHIGQTVTVSGTVAELFDLTMVEATGQTPTFTGKAKKANLPAPVVIDQNAAEAQRSPPTGPAPTTSRSRGCGSSCRSAPPTPAARRSSASSS